MEAQQHTDDEILTEFRPLFNSIKTWAYTLLTEDSVSPIELNWPELASFCTMPISELQTFLRNKVNQRLFVRGYAACIMVNEFVASRNKHGKSFVVNVEKRLVHNAHLRSRRSWETANCWGEETANLQWQQETTKCWWKETTHL
jgi:hypothetical protein